VQWVFYAIPTSALPDQKSIGLVPIKALGRELRINELALGVQEVAEALQL